MIQCSTEWFPPNHHDGIVGIKKFYLSTIGECEIQVFPYQDDTNPPTVFIVSENGIVCGIRLDAPLFWGREYNLSNLQKHQINSAVKSNTLFGTITARTWNCMKGMWSGLNDRLEKIALPDEPPDYTKLPQVEILEEDYLLW